MSNDNTRPRVVVIGGGHYTDTIKLAVMVDLLTRNNIEVVSEPNRGATVEQRPSMPLDDGFAASYLNPVAEKKFRNDKPYLKRKKGRS